MNHFILPFPLINWPELSYWAERKWHARTLDDLKRIQKQKQKTPFCQGHMCPSWCRPY